MLFVLVHSKDQKQCSTESSSVKHTLHDAQEWERWIKRGSKAEDAKKLLSWEELASRDAMADG